MIFPKWTVDYSGPGNEVDRITVWTFFDAADGVLSYRSDGLQIQIFWLTGQNDYVTFLPKNWILT